jgi:S-adenosylmethionine:tRNA ribosyltransferase-isomerase
LYDYKNIKIKDFNYQLPEEKIAKYPVANRGSSKLLVWNNGVINKDHFSNVVNWLPDNTLMVFNNTKVINARILFKKKSGANIEIFCLEPLQPLDHQLAFSERERTTWKCMTGNLKKWKTGVLEKKILINNNIITLKAWKEAVSGNIQIIEFSWNGGCSFAEVIEKAGVLPIPPYLKRETEPADEDNYQTVYAKLKGSVAAPTAGLHFTDKILTQLSDKNIQLSEITLHVGAGTFRPVRSDTVEGHTMHTEKVIISKNVIEQLIAYQGRIIAVGTTSVRSIESLYWLGLRSEEKLMKEQNLHISQWEPYENSNSSDVRESLEKIINFMNKKGLNELNFSTDIIIVPGYDFRLTAGMITNFHLPGSTLLLLVSAFLGNDWKKIYDFALAEGFRFLSYGDSNLYLKKFNV